MDVTIRRMRPDDQPALEGFYAGLSDESRRLRFFSFGRGISHLAAASFCDVDHRHREGFIALASGAAGRTGVGGPIVGHLCIEPADGGAAEIAIAVADAYQHQGIGRRLLQAGVAWARSRGIHRLTATTLETNGAIRRLVVGLGLSVQSRSEGADVAALSIDLDRPLQAAA